MLYTVYYIEKHPKDGKPYVGCTNDLKRRMSEWGHNVSTSDVEILWETPWIEDASIMEQDLQKRILGKSDGHFYHLAQSEEVRLARNKSLSDSLSVSMSGENHPMYGKTHSEESKAKMSASLSGKTHSEEHKAKISEAMSGVPKSEETKAKISEARSGVPKSEETKAKISASLSGKTPSEESKAKMSASALGRVSLNNGMSEVRILPESVDEYLSQGYTYGRLRRSVNRGI